MRARLDAALGAAPPSSNCVHRRASVLQLRRGSHWDLWLDDGQLLSADEVVLALGNPPPGCPRPLLPIEASPRYIRDPWSIGAASGVPIDSVLLLGSGLTMIDAALRLAALRPRVRQIHVLSRHGWLPQVQATQARPGRLPPVRTTLEDAKGSVLALMHAFRTLARAVSEQGGDWREVIALARPQIPLLWQSLDHEQRARFLRHARAAWEIHRHRVPAGPLAAVDALARRGVLELHAGHIVETSAAADGVEIIWRPRGQSRTRAWLVDRAVNCTGPGRVSQSADPLVQALLAKGLIRSDALDLGIDVAGDGRVIDATGKPVDHLYYLGPWLRARDWEATAVPELREHARQLAIRLLQPAAVNAPS